jgi:zinc D-Ala-D-Ala carboxypeptidase
MDFHPDFPLEVIEFSETAVRRAIDNHVPPAFMANAMKLSRVLGMINDDVRVTFPGRTLQVTSAFRSPALNTVIGGVSGSDHLLGLAADVQVSGTTVVELAKFIESLLYNAEQPYHQLINEYGSWVHIGLCKDGVQAKFEKFNAIKYAGPNGKVSTIYRPVSSFLPSREEAQ